MNRRRFFQGIAGLLGAAMVPVVAKATPVGYEILRYKGRITNDVGCFYCPYIPLTYRVGEKPDLTNINVSFKTRYGDVKVQV